MGTRADFYVDKEWIGSIAWDGYEFAENRPNSIADATYEKDFRNEVSRMLVKRKDGTTPDLGWPWPWDDSRLTDFSYVFRNGKTEIYNFGEFVISEDGETDNIKHDFPNMKKIKNVTIGPHSGLLVVQL